MAPTEMRKRLAGGATAAGAVVVVGAAILSLAPAGAVSRSAAGLVTYRTHVDGATIRGVTTLPTGTMFGDTEVGGLSGLTYDAAQGLYYAISDDRSVRSAARYYKIVVDTGDGSMDAGDVRLTEVVTLTDDSDLPFATDAIDAEAIALTAAGSLFISSEGDETKGIAPFVREFSLRGRQRDEIPLPEAFLPDQSGLKGVRNNLAFEALAVSEDGRTLYVGSESALRQDAPEASVSAGSPSRLYSFDLEAWAARSQQVYPVEPLPAAPVPSGGEAQNGLVELAFLDEGGGFLALERAAVAGRGFTARVFEGGSRGELDVSSRESLTSTATGMLLNIEPAPAKRLVVDVGETGVVPDNLEGMALGPYLPNGERFLLLVSDNNFSPLQATQFVGLGLRLWREPVVGAMAEAPPLLDGAAIGVPSIWHDPEATGETRLVAARGASGLAQLDLDGQLIAAVPVVASPSSVALVPRFFDNDPDSALVVFASRADGILRFQVTSRVPPDFHSVTYAGIETVPFPDEPAAPLGPVATFTGQGSGPEVLVAQGHRIAQLALTRRPSGGGSPGGVYGEVLRTFDIPVQGPSHTVDGISVDDEGKGYAVVAGAEEGIFSFDLDPARPPQVAKVLTGDVAGIAWFRDPAAGPLLMTSRPDVGSLLIVDPEGGSPAERPVLFTVGPDGDVDGADRPRGVSVIAADLGPSAPEGLIVVLDAMDEPQSVVEVDGNLVNRSWNVKLAPWTSALLTPAPWDTPASPATPVASPTPGATESRTSTLFIPAAAQSG